MILDNVDDEKAVTAVSKLMARLKGGDVIVTARATDFPPSLRKLELDVLDEDAGTEFLLERTRDDRALANDDEEKAREIARELGGLALGLEQAGAYIATDRIGFMRYLKLWRESRERVADWFDRTLMSYDHDAGLAATWAASVDRISPESRRMLDRLAMLASDPIPGSLLDVAVPGEAPEYDAQKARAGLYAYSPITHATGEDGSAKGFAVHRLVQDFARRAMTEERRRDALKEVLSWLDKALVGEADDESWAVIERLIKHATAVTQQVTEMRMSKPAKRLHVRISTLQRARIAHLANDFRKLEADFRKMLKTAEEKLGPNHPHTESIRRELAGVERSRERAEGYSGSDRKGAV